MSWDRRDKFHELVQVSVQARGARVRVEQGAGMCVQLHLVLAGVHVLLGLPGACVSLVMRMKLRKK